MTQTRIDYRVAAPEGYKALGRMHHYIAHCGLEADLIDLVYLRVSQINGCGYCVDLHSRDAATAGVPQRKLNNLGVWAEGPFFSDRERAALAWAESLTLVAQTHAPDSVYEAVKAQFSDKELADLSYAIALMNAFNRLGVAFRQQPEGA